MEILIADAGGTKTDWCLLDAGNTPRFFTTEGINPSVMEDSDIIEILRKVALKLEEFQISEVDLYFFGAGINTPQMAERLEADFRTVLPSRFRMMHLASDIEGAARALFGNESGIVCILGTGSASAFYDGEKIVDSVPSLGYVLGDEGSGAYMGKMLINAYFKRELTATLRIRLGEFSDMNLNRVIKNVYREPGANGYLASFVPFIKENEDWEEISDIIDQSLKLFFKKNVLKYKRYEESKIGFVGGVANTFKDRIETICATYSLRAGRFLGRPIDSLCTFYSQLLEYEK